MACKYTKKFIVTTISPIFFSLFVVWHIFRLHFMALNRTAMDNKIVIYSPTSHLATLIAAIIEDNSSQIICCTTPHQIITLCHNEPPSLIIILAIAPFMDGSNIITEIRSTLRQRLPIYVISWQQSEHVVLSLLESGADQYMTFPICMIRLRHKSIEHFEQYHLRFS